MAQRQVREHRRVDALEERLFELQGIIERQQQRVEEQHHQVERQNAEIAVLRARLDAAGQVNEGAVEGPKRTAPPVRRKTALQTSRRRLLAGAGAAAAAASLAVVGSEQRALAAPATPDNDGSSLIIGQANTGTAQTSLAITGSSLTSQFFLVDASGSFNAGVAAIQGVVSAGVGVQGRQRHWRRWCGWLRQW